MREQVLFIQGAGEGAYDEDQKLVVSLRHLLGPSYEVYYPAMQDEDDAEYKTWTRQIKEELAKLNDGVILAGHSVGGSMLIKFLSETETNKAIAGIFLIAAPFWGGDKGWTYEGYETLALPNDVATRLPEHVPVFLYQSRDDEIVPFTHLALYAKTFPGATARELDRGGHQLNNDLSVVANDIKSLS